jgi:SOS-response transcriptional repressor LexA
MTASQSPAPAFGLTPAQKWALLVIQELTAATGTPPSRRAIARELGLISPSGAHRLIAGLVERGWLEENAGNGLSVLRPLPMPDEAEFVGFFEDSGLATAAMEE